MRKARTIAENLARCSDAELIDVLPNIRDENGEQPTLTELKQYLKKYKKKIEQLEDENARLKHFFQENISDPPADQQACPPPPKEAEYIKLRPAIRMIEQLEPKTEAEITFDLMKERDEIVYGGYIPLSEDNT